MAFLVPLIETGVEPIEVVSTNSAAKRLAEIPVAAEIAYNNEALLVMELVTRVTVLSDLAKTSGEQE